jgi:hypothetical protein
MGRRGKSDLWADDGGVIREDSAAQRGADGEKDRKRRAKADRRAARAGTRRKVISVVVAVLIVTAGAALVVVRTRSMNDDAAAPVTTAPRPSTTLMATTGTTEQGVDYTRFHAGDCLMWDQHDDTSVTLAVSVLPCEQPHLIEMVSAHRVPERVTAYPDAWGPIFDEVCRADIEAYLHAPLDPGGRLVENGLKPTHSGWNSGDRQLLCGMGRAPTTIEQFADTRPGDLVAATGSSTGQTQDLLYEVGTCIRRDPYAAVECTAPHDWEVVATITLGDQPTVPAPDDGAGWAALTGGRCDRAAATYLGHALGPELWAGSMPVEQPSWAAGRRSVQCSLSRRDGAPLEQPLRGVAA